MAYALSDADRRFLERFESGSLPPAEFSHRAHVRVAYAYLVDRDTTSAIAAMRDSLQEYLRHHGIDLSKYHETMTTAWILAVRHFMQKTPNAGSADEFIDLNPLLLDGRIMLTHYSAELLSSSDARAQFVPPDLEHIPTYDTDPTAR